MTPEDIQGEAAGLEIRIPEGGPEAEAIIENSAPSSQPAFEAVPAPPSHQDTTRRNIAYALVALLAVLAGAGAWGWFIHGADLERMQGYAVLLSPVVTLVGTVLGFYFSREK